MCHVIQHDKEWTFSHSLLSFFIESPDGVSKDTNIFWHTKMYTGQEKMSERTAPESVLIQDERGSTKPMK